MNHCLTCLIEPLSFLQPPAGRTQGSIPVALSGGAFPYRGHFFINWLCKKKHWALKTQVSAQSTIPWFSWFNMNNSETFNLSFKAFLENEPPILSLS